MASNTTSLMDEDGNSSDWIEIHNSTETEVSVDGWYLTDRDDDLEKWRFPAVVISAGDYLIVFASGANRTDPARQLHTNFKLRASGEYLALLQPDLTVAHAFDPSFLPQTNGISYGAPVKATSLISADNSLSYKVPTESDAPLGTAWTQRGFDDSAWNATNGVPITRGIGYTIDGLASLVSEDIRQYVHQKNASSVWIRQEFLLEDPARLDGLLLRIHYDDGFVAFVNGQEVAKAGAPASLHWNSQATDSRPNSEVRQFVELDISRHVDALLPGTNLLAIQSLNLDKFNEDLLVRADLFQLESSGPPGYLSEATPGSFNGAARAGLVQYSHSSSTFIAPFVLSISADQPETEIRYTLDGKTPTKRSLPYTGTIDIEDTIQIRAAAVSQSGFVGPVSTVSFVRLSRDLQEFSSDLPILVLENFKGRTFSQTRVGPTSLSIFEPDNSGRSALANQPDLVSRAGVKIRGSSTASHPKKPYAMEVWNETDDDKTVSILGMPANSDWVLSAPYRYDRALIRDAFVFELSNQIGRYAPRTRFVELFANTGGGPLSQSDYQGVYSVAQKIKQGTDRVNVADLSPTVTIEPDITGGYIFKIDDPDPGDRGWTTRRGNGTLAHVYPKENELPDEQRDFIRGFVQDFEDALYGPNSSDPEIGYRAWFDVDAAIDFHILQQLTKNPDGLVRSTYLHKDRGGKITFGPAWDFDRGMGADIDTRAGPTSGWGMIYPWTLKWWSRLLRDPDFEQAWIDRWFQLRKDFFSDDNFATTIDYLAEQIAESQQRNFDKWIQDRPNGGNFAQGKRGWEGEIEHLKGWLSRRMEWIDRQWLSPPTITPDVSVTRLHPDQQVTLAADSGTIYYTLDGSDPRSRRGQVAAGAIAYSNTINLDEPATITARVKRGLDWSAPAKAVFSETGNSPDSLRITELNYHPYPSMATRGEPDVDQDEFEFIELMNIGSIPIELDGVQLVERHFLGGEQGVVFTFEPQVLQPTERIVVVENVDAFRSRYGNAVRIAHGDDGQEGDDGQFGGKLANDGEWMMLVDKHGNTIQRFNYDDTAPWPGLDDGQGFTLEIVDTQGSASDPHNWRSSLQFGGSPGAVESPPARRVVINEVLARPGAEDTVLLELFNPTDQPVGISHWYISNDSENLFKFQINAGTTIEAGGYRVFDQQLPRFSFTADGGEIWLIESDEAGIPIQLADHVQLGTAPVGVSLGRWSSDDDPLRPMAQLTFGGQNSQPWTGEVVISELHFNPFHPEGVNSRQNVNDFEFIELVNRSKSALDLGRWQLNGDIHYSFPLGTMIGAAKSVVVVPFDPMLGANAFRVGYQVNAETRLFGPYERRLDNVAGTVRLEHTGGVLPLITDELTYESSPPWPLVEQGQSLARTRPDDYGLFPTSWLGGIPTPGIVSFEPDSALRGDFNEDNMVDEYDIDLLFSEVTGGTHGRDFDLNKDARVDGGDVDDLVRDILKTQFGDANLDGRVDQEDFALLAAEFGTKDVGWGSGDFDGDRVVSFRDFVNLANRIVVG